MWSRYIRLPFNLRWQLTYCISRQSNSQNQFPKLKRGDSNCLFAASIAKKGSDIPYRNVIFRFDLHDTLIRHGRSLDFRALRPADASKQKVDDPPFLVCKNSDPEFPAWTATCTVRKIRAMLDCRGIQQARQHDDALTTRDETRDAQGPPPIDEVV
ncbi:hypothetical protein B0H63DRAFT_446188 [Podospora didyma]|uniref:Uncharacterized protein n=1 Tax=Podospora didyma TaxID=330526 RepID=A0AAE0NYK8_9PEZI|nr:hypothetical protein B0H63DRAFT_446188 [Podospora didyma]